MQDKKHVIRNLIRLFWLVTIVLSSAAYTSEAAESLSVESGVIGQACKLIYEGQFDAADELIKQSRNDDPAQLSQAVPRLWQVVDQYKSINQERQLAREAAYSEALTELEKLQAPAEANDVNDANSADDLTSILSVIVKTGEFADEAQKKQILSDPFVKEVMRKAIDKAAEYEVEGKWLEAYTNCYGWLVVIDPNNEGYSDYAQQLLDKATIAMAFEDSPCETSQERFQGVKEELFVRAINFLNSRYVSIINYNETATKAIERCKLLAEVISTSSRLNEDSENDDQGSLDAIKGTLDPEKLATWSDGLTKLLDEVKSASGGLARLDKNKFLDVFDNVLDLNSSTINLPRTVLIAQFVEAALFSLDPYTVIVWPRQVQDFEQMMTSAFTGIGIEISKQKGMLTVSSLLLDTPAFNSNLDAGDVIEEVDGVETKDMSIFCAAKKIKGSAGTNVKLKVRRSSDDKKVDDELFDVTITRDTIIVPTVRGWQRSQAGKWLYMIDEKNKIGFVRLTSFSSDTASGLEKVLFNLENRGLKGLILDLRFNTGGLLDSAVAVVDMFVEEGVIVKRQSGLGRMPIYETAKKKGTHPNYPLVILINSNSASASEIVAGALADEKYKRAILVGTRTHGKGSVQGITGLDLLGGGAQLKYTMAYYYLPSGQRVESRNEMEKLDRKDWGVAPDVEVELRSDELKKMMEIQRDNDVLVKAKHDGTNDDFKKRTIEETLAADPQLAVGLLIIQSKLIQDETLAQAHLVN
ncbi:MAG TPA: S41 family peptidase [Sedimentisphaerales bacterium]|nr:S41 family peptidase [Sedimentisphaerales bacterium]